MPSLSQTRWVLLTIATALALGCAAKPEQILPGKWEADSSATSVAIKAAKLKHDSPDAATSDVMAAARALSHVGLDLRTDKTFELFLGGATIQGSWSFDAALNEVQLDLKTATLPPEAQINEPFQPKTWVAYLDKDQRTLDLYMADRKTVEFIKQVSKGKSGSIVLSKAS